MSKRRVVSVLVAALLSVGLAAVWSCGGSKNPTSPGGGGGGAKELNSGDLAPGVVFQHRFMTAGTYPYHCLHHAPMVGSVTVADAVADTVANVSITSASMAFPAASVKTGGRVVWTNNTILTHTVTSN
jgi:plastocyanin